MKGTFKRVAARLLIAVIVFVAMVPMTAYEAEAASGYTRIYGADRYETSHKIANVMRKELGISRFDTMILASGSQYKDALSASYLASVTTSPIILTNNKVSKDTFDFLEKRLKKNGTVYIIGGTKALGTAYEKELQENYNVVRLGGVDAYATNLLVLQEGDRIYSEKNSGKTNREVMVCSALDYPDAISAGAGGNPILLVGKKLTNDQRTYLKDRPKSKFFLMGGTKAVSKGIENALTKYSDNYVRYDGATRYSTSTFHARRFFGNKGKTKEAILVNSDKFADGLSVAPLAQIRDCPILLCNKDNIAQAWNYEIQFNTKETTVIGSGSLIPTKAVATAGKLQKGWNAYNGKYVYVNDSGKIRNTGELKEAGYSIKMKEGGMIDASHNDEVSRRLDSASYGTAIVIHIGDQKLDYVENGRVKLSTDIVTGNVSRGYSTPRGTYRVRSKSRNVTLVGPGYSSFVRYWMAFIGGEYGIHDANWRNKFGGSIYKTNGSHGCVNIPPRVMPTLYSMVSVGTKVVIKK